MGRVCDTGRSAPERDRAWKELLLAIAPHVERWALRSGTLRRVRLTTEDDARAVLVALVARLAARDFDNLRQWLARQSSDDEEGCETDAIERLVRLAADDARLATDAPVADVDEAGSDDTPLRGWLLRLLRFVIKDHVKHRLGWASPSEDGAHASKRDLGTNAERLDDVTPAATRPPITDLVAMRRLMGEMMGFAQTFPAPMRAALDMWMKDATFEEIATQLGLEGPEAGRALARAAQARLRERFRDAWPAIRFGA